MSVIMANPIIEDNWQTQQSDTKMQVLYFPCDIDIEGLNKLDKDTIHKSLASWMDGQDSTNPYLKIRIQMFLSSMPIQVEGLTDLLEYASYCCFQEITGFIDYLLSCN